MSKDLRHKYCYECYADWHLCICEESVRGFKFKPQRNERIVIAGMTLTKRGERLLTYSFTILLLVVAIAVGTIESMS